MYPIYLVSENEPLQLRQHAELDHQSNLRQPSQTQGQNNPQDSGGDSSNQQNPTEPVATLLPPANAPDIITPEPERPVEQVPNKPVRMDLETIYQETLVDTKPTSRRKGIDYTSIECKSCQIAFNDNYGFRRHLNHVHPHDPALAETNNQGTSLENHGGGRSLRSGSTPTPSPSPPDALHKKNLKYNVKFKQQFRANLKLKHLKTIPLPKEYEKPIIDIQCRFCQKGGWEESEYRVHLLQRHSRELNPLSKQIADSNNDRLKETEAAASSTATNNTASTSSRPWNAANDSPTTTDTDITILDIPYDPIKDISENQRRTYQFFQTYMLDISWVIFARWSLANAWIYFVKNPWQNHAHSL